MKQAACVALLVVLAGCSSAPVRTDSTVTGRVEKSMFLTDPGHAGFRARYDTVRVDENLTGMIHSLSDGVDVIVFYGPWCGDSRVQVPLFLRIAEKSGIPDGRIRYYALDRSKSSPDGLEKRYAIERVPTFIFLRDGKEIGRVVESPRTTLEGDIVAILAAAAPKTGS